MAYVALHDGLVGPPQRRETIARSESIILVIGASATGGLAGFIASISVGRLDTWSVFFVTGGVLAVALLPAACVLGDALKRRARASSSAAVLNMIALLAWPLLVPLDGDLSWIAPAAALTCLLLLAVCWGGGRGAIYCASLQGALIAGLAAQQGALILLS